MTCEWVGVLGICLGPTQALVGLVAWTVLAAFLGRLVIAWAVSLALRHAALTLGGAGLFVGLELFMPGFYEGLLRGLLTVLGGGA